MNRAKNIFGNFLAAFAGFATKSDIKYISGFAQTGIDFCTNCGKILNRECDPSSIKRGDICLQCAIEDNES